MSFLSKLKKQKEEKRIKEEELEKQLKQEDAIESGEGFPVYKMFEYVDCVTVNKVRWEDLGPINQKTFSNLFMVNKYLSMVPEFALFISDIQKMQRNLSPEMFYRYLYDYLPKEPFYGKYIKEKETEKIPKEVLEVLIDYFEEKIENVSKYYKMLSSTDRVLLLKKYGWDDEKISKALKID